MTIKYDPIFLDKLKKSGVRIRKSFKERLEIFIKDPHNPQLNNHPLKRNYLGYRSIDITNNWRQYFPKRPTMERLLLFSWMLDLTKNYIKINSYKQLNEN